MQLFRAIALAWQLASAPERISAVEVWQNDPSAWPVGLWAAGEEGEARLAVKSVLARDSSSCAEVHDAIIYIVSRGGLMAGLATGAVVELIQQLAAHLESGSEDIPYSVLFDEVSTALRVALEVVQLMSVATMIHRKCFLSAARHALSKSLVPLQSALQQQVSTMWWMFDISQFSNTNSPAKHFKAVHSTLMDIEGLFGQLSAELPSMLHDGGFAWGHEDHGMFMNSTVMYRKLFPGTALVDKGLLRQLLRMLPMDSTVGDFGALDGQYSRWLNDTGWVAAFAFDGVQGVAELTEGRVTEVDLASELRIPWRPQGFDWVLCLEVAEHIPPALESTFLWNLDQHSASALVLSWATPDIEGEGHVNCLRLEESRRRVEALGFQQDIKATELLRSAAELSWIAASVAVYRRSASS